TIDFARVIGNYHLVPSDWVMPLAIFIPYLELAIGLMILLDFYRHLAVIAGSILIIFFTTVSMYMYFRTGVASDCGCYGKLIVRKNNLALLDENRFL
ncbi:MAG: MauE/DoxX family redox-associated membrane protein, partial [Candidatus Helarchaeota archaeon]